MSTATTPRIDVYTRVTNRIIEELEQGVRPWLKPWNAEQKTRHIGDKIMHRLNQSYQLATHSYHCTSSIGVSLFGALHDG